MKSYVTNTADDPIFAHCRQNANGQMENSTLPSWNNGMPTFFYKIFAVRSVQKLGYVLYSRKLMTWTVTWTAPYGVSMLHFSNVAVAKYRSPSPCLVQN